MYYPTEPTQDAYLVYDVKSAEDFADTAWDYAALAGKPGAHANELLSALEYGADDVQTLREAKAVG